MKTTASIAMQEARIYAKATAADCGPQMALRGFFPIFTLTHSTPLRAGSQSSAIEGEEDFREEARVLRLHDSYGRVDSVELQLLDVGIVRRRGPDEICA